MKLEFDYHQNIFSLPAIGPSTLLSLSEKALRLLIAVCAFRDTERLASELHWEKEEVLSAAGELEKAGILKSGTKLLLPSGEAPKYTGEDVKKIISETPTVRNMIEECSRIAGKMLGPMESGKILSLVDYLRLDSEYVILLYSYLAGQGKKSIAYLEKTAYNLVNDDCNTVPALAAYIRKQETVRSAEGEMRRILGAGDRLLTGREKEYIAKWLGEDAWHFSTEMVALAVETTIDSIGKQSLAYTDKILGSWFSRSLATPEDVRREEEARKNGRSSPEGSSFDVNDFFAEAVRRSYDEIGRRPLPEGNAESSNSADG